MSSNANDWESDMAGYIGVPHDRDPAVHKCQSEEEYVKEIKNFVENLKMSEANGVEEAKDFIRAARKCDKKKLEELSRADWKERSA